MDTRSIRHPITKEQFRTRLECAAKLTAQGYYQLAEELLDNLIQIDPENASVWHACGQLRTGQGRWDRVIDCHARAVELIETHGTPETNFREYSVAAMGYAQALMRFGRFAEGLKYWELGRTYTSWAPWPGCKLWEGQPCDSLLVQAEGGFGDIFMFMRWLPQAKQRTKQLGFMVFKGMRDLFDWTLFGVDEVYEVNQDRIDFGRYQYATSVMSLPYRLGMHTVDDIPDYLHRCLTRWFRSECDPPLVGFCWRAEENTSPVRTKSLPLEVAQEICDRIYHSQHVKPFSLSPDLHDLYNTNAINQPDGLVYEPGEMASWKDTINYLLRMDYVLTVDTAVAHLCGVLGVPCLVLLPVSHCWRWGTQKGSGHTSWWYGPNLKLFVQNKPFEWDATVITKVVEEEMASVKA